MSLTQVQITAFEILMYPGFSLSALYCSCITRRTVFAVATPLTMSASRFLLALPLLSD